MQVTLVESADVGDLERRVREHAVAGPGRIIVAGGDGSIHEAANGILAAGSELSAAAAPYARVFAIPMGGDLDLRLVWRIRRAIGDFQADLVHLHSRVGADVMGGIAGRLAGVPVVHSRRVDNPEPPWVVGLKYRLHDRVIEGTFVDRVGRFFLDGEFVGFVTWDVDGDGFETIWLLDRSGFVLDVQVGLDLVTYSFQQTNFIPAEFTDVRCDILNLIDDDIIGPGGPNVPLCAGPMVSFVPLLALVMLGLTAMRFTSAR